MILPAIRARFLVLAALGLLVVGVVGCNSSDTGGSAALPASTGAPPPPPPKESLGADGKPTHSSAAFDSAHPGGKAP
jgi:hypothetical protein